MGRSRSRSKSRSRKRSHSRSSPRRSPYSRRRSSSKRRSSSRSRSRSRSPRKRGRGRSPSRSPSRRRQRVPSRSCSGSRGASSDRETAGRIWVAHGDCARIIGRKGEARKDIEAQSEAQLRIQKEEDMERGSKERYVELLGNPKQRRKAIEMILKIATFCRDDNGKVLKDGQVGSGGGGTAESLIIQQGEVGKVLGRGGENIRRIEEESGARLELDRHEGRLDIRGPPEAVSKARDMVLSEVSHARNGSGSVIKDEYRNQASGGGGGGHSGGGGSSPWLFWVHSKEAGRVIGRGGEAVRELMERTGAEVKVQRGDGKDDGEREIKVSGSEAQKLEALLGISNHVHFIRCEQGVIKTPEMSAPQAEDSLRRYASGGVCPWMGGPPMMMPPGMPPPGMMPPGMPPPGMMPPGMLPGMMPPGMAPPGMPPPGHHRERSSSSSSSSSSASGNSKKEKKKKKKKEKKEKKAAKANMQNTWMDPWQAQMPMPVHNMAYPAPAFMIPVEEKKAIDWDEL